MATFPNWHNTPIKIQIQLNEVSFSDKSISPFSDMKKYIINPIGTVNDTMLNMAFPLNFFANILPSAVIRNLIFNKIVPKV